MKAGTMSMFSLQSQVAFITGAASGIGAATAEVLAAAGADLALAWYPPDGHQIEPVAARAAELGARVVTLELDVRDRAAVDAAVDQAARELGSLEIMIANAAIARIEEAPELVPESLTDLVLDVNLRGVWRCFQAAIRHMRGPQYGRLLATTSVSGPLQAWPEHASYAMSKGAINALVNNLAVELGPAGITVNCVAPGGGAPPPALDPLNTHGPEGVAGQADLTPVRRVGDARDIAAAFLYLASREASYVTGHMLVVDGGRWLAGSD
jgi:3-oxoacyl-[acyl-carrier protein] reductase